MLRERKWQEMSPELLLLVRMLTYAVSDLSSRVEETKALKKIKQAS